MDKKKKGKDALQLVVHEKWSWLKQNTFSATPDIN